MEQVQRGKEGERERVCRATIPPRLRTSIYNAPPTIEINGGELINISKYDN